MFLALLKTNLLSWKENTEIHILSYKGKRLTIKGILGFNTAPFYFVLGLTNYSFYSGLGFGCLLLMRGMECPLILNTMMSHLRYLTLICHWFKVHRCLWLFLYRRVHRDICLFFSMRWSARNKPAQSHILTVLCWSCWNLERGISLLYGTQVHISAPTCLSNWSQIFCSKFTVHTVPCVFHLLPT